MKTGAGSGSVIAAENGRSDALAGRWRENGGGVVVLAERQSRHTPPPAVAPRAGAHTERSGTPTRFVPEPRPGRAGVPNRP